MPRPATATTADTPAGPRVWVLATDRAGDRAQAIALADGLGWAYAVKDLAFNGWYRRENILLGARLVSLDKARSSPLAPPWPDLVIAYGRRSVPVARWIWKQTGGRARLVHIGRPWAPLRWFDLVVTTPQYGLPAAPNVLRNRLSLNRIDPARLAAAADAWQERLAALPRPLVAVLVGGDSRPFRIDAGAARQLGQAAAALARQAGGSVLVTTSRRTPDDAVDALFAALPDPACRHRWSPGGENPYLAFLALADRLIVTGDSASMLSEACATGKPVYIFDLPQEPDKRLRWWGAVRRFAHGRWGHWLKPFYDRLVDLGFITSTRDMSQFHRELLDGGLAQRLGSPISPQGRPAPMLDDLDRAVARVRALFAGAV